MISKIAIIFITLLGLLFSTYADTNGIWINAEDIRVGTFGEDEEGEGFRFNKLGIGTQPSSNYPLKVNGSIFANSFCLNGICLNEWQSSLWQEESSGISYQEGNVGIGTNSNSWYSLTVSGITSISGPLYMNNNQIKYVQDPTTSSDAATKRYVDEETGSSLSCNPTNEDKVKLDSNQLFVCAEPTNADYWYSNWISCPSGTCENRNQYCQVSFGLSPCGTGTWGESGYIIEEECRNEANGGYERRYLCSDKPYEWKKVNLN